MTITPEQAAAAQVTAQAATAAQETAQPAGEGTPAGSKLSDADAALLKENMSMKRKLQAIEAQQAAEQKKGLEDQGKYKELAELAQSKSSALEQRLIKAELLAKLPGLIDPELIKLCDTSTCRIADDGTIEGLAEVAEAFQAAKPTFFGTADYKPVVPGTPKPGATSGASGPRSYDDYENLPRSEQIEWATKNPQAFQALADAAMRQKG